MPDSSTARNADFSDQLYDAALHLFAMRGIGGLSMRALAQEMGTSTMKTYHYFRDRDAVVAELLTRTYARFCDRLTVALATDGSAADKVRAFARTYVAFAANSPESYHVLFDLPHPAGEVYAAMHAAINKLPQLIESCADALLADGAARGTAAEVSATLWAALHGAVSLSLAGKLPANVAADRVVDRLLAGLLGG